jgi:ABC-type multidrug transport system ATPase subunit
MQIAAQNLSKRFDKNWIFKNLTFNFQSHQTYVITGPNGSGKSTLLKILSGAMLPTRGILDYSLNGIKISPDVVFRHITFSAPYMELIDEFTIKELLNFHFRFKVCINQKLLAEEIEKCGLGHYERVQVKDLSSGMKQRLKLLLCFHSESSLMILDEPCTNLDKKGVIWYNNVMENQLNRKTIIIASNDPREYRFKHEIVDVDSYK